MGVVIKSPVIVCALYDIGRDVWNSFDLSYNTYLWWMKNTLSLDANMVIYTENRFFETIERDRKEFDPNFDKTILINKPLEELDCYKLYYNRLENLISSEAFKKKINEPVPEMTQPLYNIIMFNKLHFLKEAYDRRYFDNDFLIWADAGGLREGLTNYSKQVWPSLEKINQLDNSKITFFSHDKNVFVEDNEYHALSQCRKIQGTSFFSPSHLIDDFTKEFNETVDECLKNGFIGSDEKILDITFSKEKNRNKFNVIKCDWRTYFKIFKDDGNDLNLNSSSSKKVFLDLGSFECSSLFSKVNELDMDSSWEIHVFEPNPLVDTKSYAKRISVCPIMVYKNAIWKREGKAILNQYGNDGRSQGTLLEETGGGKDYGDYWDSIIVNSTDIYEFLKGIGDKEIYVFMDIECSEYEVLEHLLNKGWPKNIKKLWVEWHGIHSKDNVIRAKSIIRKIMDAGTFVEVLNKDSF